VAGRAVKIHNEISQWMLTTELIAAELLIPQACPEALFRRGLWAA
jgi:hypothetical protein